MGRELLARVDTRLRGDVVAIDHHLVVAASFDDAGHAEQRMTIGRILGAQEPKVQRAGLYRFGFVGGIGVIAQILAHGAPSKQLLGVCAVEVDLLQPEPLASHA